MLDITIFRVAQVLPLAVDGQPVALVHRERPLGICTQRQKQMTNQTIQQVPRHITEEISVKIWNSAAK